MLHTLIILALSACPAADLAPADTSDPIDTADTGDTAASEDLVSECTTTGCGGDVVGLWTIQQACVVSVREPMAGCPSGYSELMEANMAGTVDLVADGTYNSVSTGSSATIDFVFPAECTEGAECASYGETMGGLSCVDRAEGGCTCTAVYEAGPSAEDGTWSVAGTELTLQSSAPDVEPVTTPYCADVDELWVGVQTGESGSFNGIYLTR